MDNRKLTHYHHAGSFLLSLSLFFCPCLFSSFLRVSTLCSGELYERPSRWPRSQYAPQRSCTFISLSRRQFRRAGRALRLRLDEYGNGTPLLRLRRGLSHQPFFSFLRSSRPEILHQWIPRDTRFPRRRNPGHSLSRVPIVFPANIA